MGSDVGNHHRSEDDQSDDGLAPDPELEKSLFTHSRFLHQWDPVRFKAPRRLPSHRKVRQAAGVL